MKLKKKLLLTVGREYGSGGHLICEALGKALDIPVYDRNLIAEIAVKNDMDAHDLRTDDERLSNPFFESYYAYGAETTSRSTKLFTLQSAIIKEKAKEGSAIFVGRCADDILKDEEDMISIFIYAPYEDRIQRIMEIEGRDDRKAVEKKERRVEKSRRTFYQFYTDRRWGGTEGRDLLINSSSLGIEGTVSFILGFLHMKGYVEE